MRALDEHHDVDTAWPRSADESRDLAAGAAASGVEVIVAMGGDGVVHHVAQGMIGTASVLGIVPVGTTNVLARILGAPAKPKKAVRVLRKGFDAVRVPTLGVEGRSAGSDVRASALFSLGIGADAAVVERAETDPTRKLRFGSLHYFNTAMATIAGDLRKRDPDIRITAGEHRADGIGAMAQFHPAYTYFGRVPLSFGDPDPLTLLVVESLRLRRTPRLLLAAARPSKTLDGVGGLSLWSGIEEFRAESETPFEIQIDGEMLPSMTRVDVSHRPESLTVAVSPVG